MTEEDRSTKIYGDQIADKSLRPSEFDTDNNPLNRQSLAYDASTGKMKWMSFVTTGRVYQVTTDYLITDDDDIIVGNPNSTVDIDITLPDATTRQNRNYTVKRISLAKKVTVNTISSQTIDGILSYVLRFQYDSVTVVSDGENWLII